MNSKVFVFRNPYFITFLFGIFIFSVLTTSSFSEEIKQSVSSLRINNPENWYVLKTVVELGFIDVLSHKIQFGSDGSKFDYVEDGGQDVLFPFARISAELKVKEKHSVIFLIQPLDIKTEVLLDQDIVVDELTFPENTPLELRYGFPFYRISYLYDFLDKSEDELAIGASFQLRNATINFASSDGKLLRTNRNVGPVPIFKARVKKNYDNGFWVGGEFDGFYASGKYITGSENDFEGAIFDLSLRTGFLLSDSIDSYLNVRYIGGGAQGTNKDEPGPGDGYTDNWLHTLSISLGFVLK